MIAIWNKTDVETSAASKQAPADMVVVLRRPRRSTISINFREGQMYVIEHSMAVGSPVKRESGHILSDGTHAGLSAELHAILNVWAKSLKDSVRLEDFFKINNML